MSGHEDLTDYRRLTDPAGLLDRYREDMWGVISRSWSKQAARHQRARAARYWGGAGLGLAASLIIGIYVGRWSSGLGVEPAPASIIAEGIAVEYPLPTLYRVAVGEHLRQAETLLMLFESSAQADAELVGLARELAAASRLLMASDAGRDAEVRAILLDLELLLIQIARLAESNDSAEMQIVRAGIAETETLVRIRRMLSQDSDPIGI